MSPPARISRCGDASSIVPHRFISSGCRKSNLAFGERDVPIMSGWIMAGHQLGAATAAFWAGRIRGQTGTYLPVFVTAGALAVADAIVIARARRSCLPRPPLTFYLTDRTACRRETALILIALI